MIIEQGQPGGLKEAGSSYPAAGHFTSRGFTLIELITVIVLLGLLAVTAVVKWPSDMEEQAAVRDFIRGVRYAQHKSMTRKFTTTSAAWGIETDTVNNRYTVKRADGSETAESDYDQHPLPGNTSISAGSVWFNGLGEPIDPSGNPLGLTTFTIGASTVKVHQETGYVE